MSTFNTSAFETIDFDPALSLTGLLIVVPEICSFRTVRTILSESFDSTEEEFSALLIEQYKNLFADSLPEEYFPIVTMKGAQMMNNPSSSGLFIQLDIFAKEDLIVFGEQYREYVQEFKNKGRHIENKRNVFARNRSYFYPENIEKREPSDLRTERIVKRVPAISSFDFSIHPSIMNGITFSKVSELRIAETQGKSTPLRFGERRAFGLQDLDFSLKMFNWMNNVVGSICSKSGEAVFYSANTVTEEGIKFFTRKGGYLLPEEFDRKYPDLRKSCPGTLPDTDRDTRYTYRFTSCC